jgi:Zn-dependent protease with chaperone function
LIAGAKDIFGGNGTVYEKHLSDSLQRHEFEADALSLKLLEKAGYPKEAAVSALLKIANHECAHQPMNTLNTNTFAHPSAERRLEQINDLLPTPIKIKYHRYKYYIESGKATIPGQSEWQKIERKP